MARTRSISTPASRREPLTVPPSNETPPRVVSVWRISVRRPHWSAKSSTKTYIRWREGAALALIAKLRRKAVRLGPTDIWLDRWDLQARGPYLRVAKWDAR